VRPPRAAAAQPAGPTRRLPLLLPAARPYAKEGTLVFIRRATFTPIIGKTMALRDALVALNTLATPRVIARRIGGPVQFAINQAFDDLAAFEDWYRRYTPNPEIVGLVTSAAWELWDLRVPPPPNAPPANFTTRTTYRAASIPALRELLSEIEQRVSKTNAAGGVGNVWLSVTGVAPCVAVVNGFESLAAFEKSRAAGLAVLGNMETLAFAQRIAPLLAGPQDGIELFEILTRLA